MRPRAGRPREGRSPSNAPTREGIGTSERLPPRAPPGQRSRPNPGSSGSSLPPARFESAEREEEREGDEVQVVHDVLRVEHALGEVVVVLEDREVLEHLAPRAARVVRAPPDDPEHQENAERRDRGDDLVLGQRRGEEAHRDERATHEEEPEVARRHRSPLEPCKGDDDPRVEEREREHERVERERGEVLPSQHGAVAHRVREQELDRARAPPFGDEPHRHQRHQQKEDDADIREQRPHHADGHVHLAGHRRVHDRLYGREREVRKDAGEEVACDQREDRRDHVRDRRREVEPHLLLEDRPDPHAPGSSAACSPATIRMKTSSSVVPTRLSSSRPHRCCAASSKISRRTSRPRADSTRYFPPPSVTARPWTATTPAIVRIRSSTAAGGAAISTSTRAVGKNWSTSVSIGPCATIDPLLMITTPSHTTDTSGRMCVERITV